MSDDFAFKPKRGVHVFHGMDEAGKYQSVGMGDTPDIAETRAKDEAARHIKKQGGDIRKWKFMRGRMIGEQ